MTKQDIRVAIAGGGDVVYDLVDEFPTDIQFDLFGVGKIERKFNSNVNYIVATDDQEVAQLAVEAVINGADILFKGLIQTHTLLKEVLQKKYRLINSPVLSHVSVLDIPNHRGPILLTDAAMNIDPDLEQTQSIINNAVEVARSLGIKRPKVALLSSAENYNPKMPSSVWGQELMAHYQSRPILADIYGPISLDLALSKEIAAEKNFTESIAGAADILVVPNIDVGNVLYKSLILFTETKIGGMIVGASVPIVLTSRGDKLENKKASLQFALDVI